MLAEELKMRRVERKIHLTYKRLIKSEEIKKMNQKDLQLQEKEIEDKWHFKKNNQISLSYLTFPQPKYTVMKNKQEGGRKRRSNTIIKYNYNL